MPAIAKIAEYTPQLWLIWRSEMSNLHTYIIIKALSRIERMIMNMQFLSPYGTFIKRENNRERYTEIIYNLETTKFFTPLEIKFMRSQIKCVPHERV